MYIGYVMQADSVNMDEISGPQAHVSAIIKGFQKRGHRVRLVAIREGLIQWTDDLVNWQIAPNQKAENRLIRLTERPIRRVQSTFGLPFFRYFDSLHFASVCAQLLDGADLSYERFGMLGYGGLIASRRLGIPHIYEVNGDLTEEYARYGMNLSRSQWAVFHWVTRRMFDGAAHSIAVDRALRDRIIRLWEGDPARISVIQNGADYDLFAAPRSKVQIRHEYGISGSPIIVFVGGFFPWSGLEILLRAFSILLENLPGATMVLIGDGPERSSLEELMDTLQIRDSVVLTGLMPKPQVADIVATADIAVAPYINWRESTGLKVFEYMAAGKAIVMSATDTQHPILTNKVDSLLVEPGDVEDLALALELLGIDEGLRRTLGQTAQELSRTSYTWEHTVQQIEAICLEHLPQENPGHPIHEDKLHVAPGTE